MSKDAAASGVVGGTFMSIGASLLLFGVIQTNPVGWAFSGASIIFGLAFMARSWKKMTQEKMKMRLCSDGMTRIFILSI